MTRPVFTLLLTEPRTGVFRRIAALCACFFIASAVLFSGCSSYECCLTKPGGIFSKDKKEVERLSSSKESEVIERAAAASEQKRDAWEPTESELRYAREHNVDLKDYVWSAQRPNGGVLFPQRLPAPGPIVVMEPAEICAPVGTDIILVASYVAEGSEYMKVGEKVSWDLAGVGQFVSTNPTNASSFLKCPWSDNKKAVEGRSFVTETSARLYNITRGTEAKDDDVAILRGQTWMAVTSYEEGTSTVTVEAPTVPDWSKRRAGSKIHWVDAAFMYPKARTMPLKMQTKSGGRAGFCDLETVVIRRSDAEALSDWKVRYEVLNGFGVFDLGNGNYSRTTTVSSDATGAAKARITQTGERLQAGTSQVKVSILRPGTTEFKEAVVSSRTIGYTWTASDVLSAELMGPKTLATGQEGTYEIYINNFSEFYYSATLSIELPSNVQFVNCDANLKETTDANSPRKIFSGPIYNLKAQECTTIRLVVRKLQDGPMSVDVWLSNKNPSERPTDVRQAGGGTQNAAPSAPSNSGPTVSGAVQPPVTGADAANTQPSL